ncbi:MAG: hypothetical protein ACK45F_05600 [bacterium]
MGVNVPILTLLADRILGVPTPKVIRWVWIPGGLALAVVLVVAGLVDRGLVELVGWGAAGGAVATVALDVVRLFGYHVLRSFPADMPRIFGLLALGLGRQLQENTLAEMVRHLAQSDPVTRRRMLEARLLALSKLREPVRASVMRGMRKGLQGLAEDRREGLVQTQLEVLAAMPGEVRRRILRAMDLAMVEAAEPVYAQPRGLPRIPMSFARELLAVAIPRTAAESGVGWGTVLTVGYGWHLLNGLGFGIAYTLLFGRGTWALALGWGLFIWAGMMVTMPIMMRASRFPMPGFLVVPFVAHVASGGPSRRRCLGPKKGKRWT